MAGTPPSRPDALDTCQEQLRLAQRFMAAEEVQRSGTPVPFPEDLPTHFRPDHFESAVRAALADCPTAPLEVALVDCSEFPCMAFFSQPEGGYNHAVDGLRACEAWQARFGTNGGSANASFMTDAGPREYGVAIPRPEGRAVGENDSKRFQARVADGESELMARWGGRPPTDVERAEATVAFWERVGDEQMLERATAELEEARSGAGEN